MISIDSILEANVVPDPLIRLGIRHLLGETLKEKCGGSVEERQARLQEHIDGLRRSPIAVQTLAANEQHYEVPTAFYQYALGKRLKYSSGYWPADIDTLDECRLRCSNT